MGTHHRALVPRLAAHGRHCIGALCDVDVRGVEADDAQPRLAAWHAGGGRLDKGNGERPRVGPVAATRVAPEAAPTDDEPAGPGRNRSSHNSQKVKRTGLTQNSQVDGPA